MATHKVIPFAAIPQALPAVERITQSELVYLIEAKNALAAMKANVTTIEYSIQSRLESGAEIESGTHVAGLKENFRRSVSWREVAERLGDRLYGTGKGAPYCERVIGSTKPSRTVSLIVN